MSDFLAVDCSSEYLTVAAVKDGRAFVRHIPDCGRNHSVVLSDEIDGALAEAGMTCGDCDFFAAVTGPGSFTGIRIGVATVKGLAMGAGKPAVGITSFDLAAYNVNSENFCVVIDAAHGCYYVRGYGKNAFPPAYLTAEETAALKCPLYGFGDLPFVGYTRLDAGKCLAAAAEKAAAKGYGGLSALYVKRPQAEENAK